MTDTIIYTFDRREVHDYEPELPGLDLKDLAEDIIRQQHIDGELQDSEFPITIYVAQDDDEPWSEFKVELICRPEFYARSVA